MRRIYLLYSIGVMFAAVLLPGCSSAPDFWREAKSGQKRVLVSFPPLFAITHAVAGEDAYVLSMLANQGPHDYEGTQTDLFKVNKADLYIYNGLTLDDSFTQKMLRNHKNRKLAILNVGEAIDAKKPDLIERGKVVKHQHADGTWHTHGAEDPHLWLGPAQAAAMAAIIAEKLGEIDPPHADAYKKRAADFAAETDKLQAYGDAAFQGKTNKKLVTMHESLKYFARAFKLEIVGSIQTQPGIDPDAKKIADLKELCKEKDVRVIAIEPQYSARDAEALQASLKRGGLELKIVTLDPLETAGAVSGTPNPDPGYYLKKMRENIDTLAAALP